MTMPTVQKYPDRSGHWQQLTAARTPLVSRTTPVASIGSCFAREIKNWLVHEGWNYVQTSQHPAARHGSAAWERVYNTFCLRQEVERALDDFRPDESVWHLDGMLADPYRKGVRWRDWTSMADELDQHCQDAWLALTTCRVLIVTVGLAEIWQQISDGAVFYQMPPSEVYAPERHTFRVSTVEENVWNLERLIALVLKHNPDCHIILTVSPVPLAGTFRDDNVIVANTVSKAIVRVAVDTVVASARTSQVQYFPAYELVQITGPGAFEPDARHVRPDVVASIMQAFITMFGHRFTKEE